MKILFLNCWDARVGEDFFDFISKESQNVDAFCLQEVKEKTFNRISKILEGWQADKLFKDQPINDWSFDQAFFCRKEISAKVSKDDFMKIGTGQYIQLNLQGKEVLICNIQGVALPGDKFDTEERIKQSQQIVDFVKGYKIPTIIGGDFNLMPDTKSIKMIEDAGFKNLIKEFGIKETRNRVAWDYFKDTPGYVQQHFADFCFVSSGVKVKSFEVPELEVSDHLPMILEFELA